MEALRQALKEATELIEDLELELKISDARVEELKKEKESLCKGLIVAKQIMDEKDRVFNKLKEGILEELDREEEEEFVVRYERSKPKRRKK